MVFRFLGGALLRSLSEVTTKVLTDAACKERYAGIHPVDPATQVCSGGNNEGACQVT